MKRQAWFDAKVKKPSKNRVYEMCLLDLGDRFVSGWWTGVRWDGLHYKGQEVQRWKYLGNDGLTFG